MRRRVVPILLALFLPALFTSCSSHPPLSGLAFEVIKLERGTDGTAKATLQVDNSAVVAFNIASSKHQLFLNGQLAGTIDLTDPMGVPPQHVLTQTATVKLAGGALPAGPASYRLDSVLTLLLYGNTKETDKLSFSGMVQVQ